MSRPRLPSPEDKAAFLEWAFGDLKANNVRGVFAEWLVSRLLGISPPVRDSWAEWDLRFGDATIEVKAAAYLQTWTQSRPSKIVFSGLSGKRLESSGKYAAERTYNADWYVFCLQTELNPDRWEAFDLNQWRFFVLPRQQVERRSSRSVSLSVLRSLTPELNHAEFQRSMLEALGQNEDSKSTNGE